MNKKQLTEEESRAIWASTIPIGKSAAFVSFLGSLLCLFIARQDLGDMPLNPMFYFTAFFLATLGAGFLVMNHIVKKRHLTSLPHNNRME